MNQLFEMGELSNANDENISLKKVSKNTKEVKLSNWFIKKSN